MNVKFMNPFVEAANVITGRASVALAQAGYVVNLSPPALILGKGTTLFTPDLAHLSVPLQSACGTITIHLALRENASPGSGLMQVNTIAP